MADTLADLVGSAAAHDRPAAHPRLLVKARSAQLDVAH
jgi:hypothetical protein